MLVQVTQEDIQKGCQGEGHTCPIANALARATGSPWVWVGSGFSAIYSSQADRDNWSFCELAVKKWDVADTVAEIIRRNDDTGEMSPFEFEL
jgi:hypothetical protein